MVAVPALVWLLWLQGWEEAPSIVTTVADSWQRHNPHWTVHKVHAGNLDQFIDTSILRPMEGSMTHQDR